MIISFQSNRVCSHLIEDKISPAALGDFQQFEHALGALGDHGVPPALVAGSEGFTVHLDRGNTHTDTARHRRDALTLPYTLREICIDTRDGFLAARDSIRSSS